jgi:multimeric flavodoxin WrbA
VQIIGISGSPRKGNTEWMLDKFRQYAAQNGAAVETLLLRKMDVRQCRGCLSCEKGGRQRPGICVIKDAMTEVYPRLLKADAFVLASPAYFGMLSGLLKNFLDRTTPIWPYLAGKTVAGLAVAEEGTGQTIQNFKHYAAVCQMSWAGSVTVLAKMPGDAVRNSRLPARLERLARKLVLSGPRR